MAALAGTLSVSRSAHAAGDDVIKVALIGCGRRGRGAILPGPDGSHETATAITGKYDPYN